MYEQCKTAEYQGKALSECDNLLGKLTRELTHPIHSNTICGKLSRDLP